MIYYSHICEDISLFLTNLEHLELPFYAHNKVTSVGLLVES